MKRLIASLWAWPFFRFALVGTGGFVVDTVVLYAMLALGLGVIWGRVVSYPCAATFTWFGNRTITFAGTRATAAGDVVREWLRFLVTNLGGMVVNFVAYYLVVKETPIGAAYPVLGVAAGALSGLTVNFFASRWLVFTGNRTG